jgi:hypothetical protein
MVPRRRYRETVALCGILKGKSVDLSGQIRRILRGTGFQLRTKENDKEYIEDRYTGEYAKAIRIYFG